MPLVLLAALLLLPALPSAAQPQPADSATQPADTTARHLLWEVEGPSGGTVYLLGSIHLLRPEVYPLPEAIEAAYRAADRVAFELDLQDVRDSAIVMMQRGAYGDGRTLRTELPEALMADFDAAASGLGLNPAMFHGLEPWMASLTLSSLVLQQAGFSAEQGLDAHFAGRAAEDSKPRLALESLAFQIDLFDTMADSLQTAFLQYTLDELDGTAALMDTLTGHWQRGDAEALTAYFDEAYAAYPEIFDRIAVDRNHRWLPQMTAWADEEATTLVVVGALHLVGEEGLVALLREAGYPVTQR